MKNIVKKRRSLALSLVLYVFAIMIAAMLLSVVLVALFDAFKIFDFGDILRFRYRDIINPFRIILAMIIFSSVLGLAISAFLGKIALKPIVQIIEATRKVASGDFDTRVEAMGIRELEELSHSFNKMIDDLSSIETLRSDFVNNFSHELKTPIVSIRGFAKLLKEGQLHEDEQQEYLDIIITESERLSTLSENVLKLSKFESIEIITEKAYFRMDEQIRRIVVMTEPKWSEKNIEVDIEMDEVNYNGNENLLQQIWINLLDNAVKFSEAGGKIEIRLVDSGEAVCFSISDDGIGMNNETQLRIYEKFYQGDNSHKQEGNGIGLTMVKRIVSLHGGHINVSSHPGQGSEFTVVLPK